MPSWPRRPCTPSAGALRGARLAQARQQLAGKVGEALAGLVDVEPPETMVGSELNQRVQGTVQQFQAQGIDFEQWLQATGQDPQQFVESMREPAEQAAKVDLALRAVADAEALDVADDDLEREYERMAMQYGQKAKDIRRIYERNDAVPELIAQIRKSKAMDWLVHHVEMVDEEGRPIDRDAVLGHAHDPDGEHPDDVDDVDDLDGVDRVDRVDDLDMSSDVDVSGDDAGRSEDHPQSEEDAD